MEVRREETRRVEAKRGNKENRQRNRTGVKERKKKAVRRQDDNEAGGGDEGGSKGGDDKLMK